LLNRKPQESGVSKPDRIGTATEANFRSLVLEGKGPIAVEFMSYGCAHCRVLEPILQEVAEELGARVAIFRVNLALAPRLAETWQVEGTPTLVMFLDGQEVGRASGPHPAAATLLAVVTRPFLS
jgi:thioredoxin 1